MIFHFHPLLGSVYCALKHQIHQIHQINHAPLLTTMRNLLAALGTRDSPRMASTWGSVAAWA